MLWPDAMSVGTTFKGTKLVKNRETFSTIKTFENYKCGSLMQYLRSKYDKNFTLLYVFHRNCTVVQ